MRHNKRPDAEIGAGKQIVSVSDRRYDLQSFRKSIIASDRPKVEKNRMLCVLSALPLGYESSVLTPALVAKTGYSVSMLKNTIRVMRIIGIPVASSPRGYYLCVNDDERQMFYETLMKRIRTAVEESECFCVRRKRSR